MKRLLLILALAGLPAFGWAASVTGTLLEGGGADDLHLVVQPPGGARVWLYCNNHCGDWFETEGETEVQRLKPGLKGKRISVQYVNEPNRSRIAGPGDDEKLNFVQQAQLQK